jgi:hypothetical protein
MTNQYHQVLEVLACDIYGEFVAKKDPIFILSYNKN